MLDDPKMKLVMRSIMPVYDTYLIAPCPRKLFAIVASTGKSRSRFLCSILQTRISTQSAVLFGDFDASKLVNAIDLWSTVPGPEGCGMAVV